MEKFIKIFSLLISCLMFIACSDGSSNNAEAKKDHVWKETTDTIDRAKEVEGMLMESAENTRSAIESQ